VQITLGIFKQEYLAGTPWIAPGGIHPPKETESSQF